MRNLLVVCFTLLLLMGTTFTNQADAFQRSRSRSRCCCQQQSCCQKQKTCCPAPTSSCCSSSCGAVASAEVAQPAVAQVSYAEPVSAAPVVSSQPVVFDAAPMVSSEVGVVSAPVQNDAWVGEPIPMQSFDAAPADCGCGSGVYMDDSAAMTYPMESVASPIVEGEAAVEGASDVPASPVLDDSSSYFGAPALNPGEWVVEGSEVVVVEGDGGATTAAGVEVKQASASGAEVIYDSQPATPASTEAAVEATDAVPSAPSEDTAATKEG